MCVGSASVVMAFGTQRYGRSRRRLDSPGGFADATGPATCPYSVAADGGSGLDHPRPGTAADEGQQVGPPEAAEGLAVLGGRARQGARRHRVVDVRFRRLSAVGNGHRDRPCAERARGRFQRAAGEHGAQRVDRSGDDGARRHGPRRHACARGTDHRGAGHHRRAGAGGRGESAAVPGGRRDRPARDPVDRGRPLRGRRCRQVRPQEGPRPLPRDTAAGPARQLRDRRAPHHLRSTVLRHRPGHARRRDHRHHARGALRVHRHRSTDRRPRRLPGGGDDRPDDRHADAHVVPPALHRPRSHRDHERARSDAVRPGR